MRCSARKSRTSALAKVSVWQIPTTPTVDNTSCPVGRRLVGQRRVDATRTPCKGVWRSRESANFTRSANSNWDKWCRHRSMDDDGQQVMPKPYMSGRSSCRPFRVQHVTLHFFLVFFCLLVGGKCSGVWHAQRSLQWNSECRGKNAMQSFLRRKTRWNMIAVWVHRRSLLGWKISTAKIETVFFSVLSVGIPNNPSSTVLHTVCSKTLAHLR